MVVEIPGSLQIHQLQLYWQLYAVFMGYISLFSPHMEISIQFISECNIT